MRVFLTSIVRNVNLSRLAPARIGLLFWAVVLSISFVDAAEPQGNQSPAVVLATMPKAEVPASRHCLPFDVVGTWELVAYGSPHQFKNPDAPYLYPYQVFEYSKEGMMRSAHSPTAFTATPSTVLGAITASLAYEMVPNSQGLLAVKRSQGHDIAETWQCRTATIDQIDLARRLTIRRGDLVLTLLGRSGQPLFSRHLRRY